MKLIKRPQAWWYAFLAYLSTECRQWHPLTVYLTSSKFCQWTSTVLQQVGEEANLCEIFTKFQTLQDELDDLPK